MTLKKALEIYLTCPRKEDLTLDFFCGGGTIPVAAKMLGRHFLAFEILPEVAEQARKRVRDAQIPLFTLEGPEQLEML